MSDFRIRCFRTNKLKFASLALLLIGLPIGCHAQRSNSESAFSSELRLGIVQFTGGASHPVWVVMDSPQTEMQWGYSRDVVTKLLWEPVVEKLMTWSEANEHCTARQKTLPSIHELVSLIDFTRQKPFLDATVFGGTYAGEYTWSSSPGGSGSYRAVWFQEGRSAFESPATPLAVRCVSRVLQGGAPPESTHYVVSQDTVQDKWTNLTWQRARSDTALDHDAAMEYCLHLGLDGASWRVPTLKELLSLVDGSRARPVVNPDAFPKGADGTFLSDTNARGYAYWSLSLSDGVHRGGSRTGWVRCVKQETATPPDRTYRGDLEISGTNASSVLQRFYGGHYTAVAGSVRIFNTPLGRLNLRDLRTVGGTLAIDNNPTLREIDLSRLKSISGDLDILENAALGSGVADGDPKNSIIATDLKSIGGQLLLANNPGLPYVELQISEIGCLLSLNSNPRLQGVKFRFLKHIGKNISPGESRCGTLDILGNTALQSVDMTGLEYSARAMIFGNKSLKVLQLGTPGKLLLEHVFSLCENPSLCARTLDQTLLYPMWRSRGHMPPDLSIHGNNLESFCKSLCEDHDHCLRSYYEAQSIQN